MARLGKFQMLTFSHWKGLTKDNHLGSVFQLQPQRATTMMVQLLAMYRGKNLETYLSQFPTKEFDTDDEYTWDVIASSRRNIPLVEARDEDGKVVGPRDLAGVGGAPFYVVFAEDWFADGNVIVGEKNEFYPLRILGDPRMEGTNAVYKVELMGGVTTGMPGEELQLGKRFSDDYSPVEKELSRKVGDLQFTSPVAMRNEWSRIRIQHKVPGSMLGKKLAVGIPSLDPQTGKKFVTPMWMHHVEWVFENKFSENKNNLIMYGRSNKNRNGEYLNIGKSGNVITMGAGLREQMEVGNVVWYNDFSLKLIEDMLYELSISKLAMNKRVFILRTGERGAVQFHRAAKDMVSGWLPIPTVNNPAVIQKVQSALNSNAVAATDYQFVEWRAPMGVIVKVEVDPFYDDPVRNKIIHPDGGVAESYRYDIMYAGDMDQPNIQLAKAKNSPEMRGYQWGFRNPFTGGMNNNNMSYDEDSCVVHGMWTGGVFILDTTRVVSLIPAILAA